MFRFGRVEMLSAQQRAFFARRILEICNELQSLRNIRFALVPQFQDRQLHLEAEMHALDCKLFPGDQLFQVPEASTSWRFN
jgi:hypothetical protein